MPKTWNRNKKDLKDLRRWATKGRTVYFVVETATNLAPYEDQYLYSSVTCSGTNWITGAKMFSHMSVDHTLFQYGPLYDAPPSGYRALAGPAPQVAGPLPHGDEFDRDLTDTEIEYLESRVAERNKATRFSRRGC